MGSYLSQPVLKKESSSGENGWLTFACSAMQGWRRSMEDAHICGADVRDASVFGVFDGHGGAEVARFVARHMVEHIPETWSENPEATLKGVFHRMDDLLRDPHNADELASLKNGGGADKSKDNDASKQRAQEAVELLKRMMLTEENGEEEEEHKVDSPVIEELPSEAAVPVAVPVARVNGRRRCELADHPLQAGCTAVVVLASQRLKKLVCANAGDSRAVLSRRGKAIDLSKDHKPKDAIEEARVEKAGGFVECANGFHRINGNLNLSRSIGDLKYKQSLDLSPAEQIITAEPDVLIMDLEESDDFFVVACDGVFDVLSSQDLIDFIQDKIDTTPLADICEAVFDRCVAQNPRETGGIGGDNMTCTIVKLKNNLSFSSLYYIVPTNNNHIFSSTRSLLLLLLRNINRRTQQHRAIIVVERRLVVIFLRFSPNLNIIELLKLFSR